VLVSSATRTQQTWQLVTGEFHHTGEVQFERAIYEASVEDLLAMLRSQDDDELNLVMVGHSPGLEGLALLLSAGLGDSQLREQIMVKFPTSAVVRLRTDEPWSQAGAGKFELSDFYVA
jgi:phosphohistidine phosphatase